MPYFAHLANALFLLMYLLRDILWLRVTAILAGLALYPYYLWGTAEPLWVPIAWNTVFNAINLVQLRRLLRERRPVRLSRAERDLHRAAFATLSARDFLQLHGAAQELTAEPGACLVPENHALDRLLLICDGAVAVRVGEREVARLGAHRFVGEMSFLTRERTSASVWASAPTRYLCWSRAALDRLWKRRPSLRASLQAILGADMAQKLRAQAAQE